MSRIKGLLKRIFFLPPLPTIWIGLPSLVLVFVCLGLGVEGPLAYVSYGLSAYALVILSTGAPRIARAARTKAAGHPLVKKLHAHPLGGRYLSDAAFRAELSLYPSLCINLIYAGAKLVSGVYYDSAWFVALAIYYMLLAVMRFLLLTSARKRRGRQDLFGEYRRCRVCGVLLAVMTLALSFMVMLLIQQAGNYDYPGALIYVMAMYAFYSVIIAVVNVVKFRKLGSPILSAAKAINFAAALVSMLALETAMLTQFGREDQAFRHVMLSATGSVVCGLALAMAISMIVRANRQLKRFKSEGAETNG